MPVGKLPSRSPCPVSQSLDLLGDRWTLLVVRDLFLGRERFKELVSSPERIPTNILSDRLRRLLEHGLVRQVPATDGTRRSGYQLTAKGMALAPVLKTMRDWGLKWIKGTRAAREKLDRGRNAIAGSASIGPHRGRKGKAARDKPEGPRKGGPAQ